MPRILVIEDDRVFAQRVARNLEVDGYVTDHADSAERALELLAGLRFDGILCDVRMPGMGGLEFLRRVKTGQESVVDPSTPVLMLTSVNSVETAVEAMRTGASDYLTKEAGRAEIAVRLRRALDQRGIVDENERLRETIARVDEFSDLVGDSPAMRRLKSDISEVAATGATVLILGETGTGKELAARALHRASGRRGPFVDLNAALLSEENLLQSELFGHERGSFTDAKAMKKGKLELAHEGTLFLDEIGELSPAVQAKLLRVLETMSFTRVGGTRPLTVDVRLVAATNRDLAAHVASGAFREDLYYRINVFPITLPPLRERREDIPVLADYFLARFAAKYSRPLPRLEPAAVDLLRAASWQGNIRELRNICERLLIRARGGTAISPADVRACGVAESPHSHPVIQIPEAGLDLEEVERNLVIEALRRADWNQTEAAALLSISVDRMNNRVKKFGLTNPKWRVNRGGEGKPED